jgi:hypothetical protein
MAVTKLMAKIYLPVRRGWHAHVRGAYIVGIGEETDTSDNAGADVIPAKGSFVDLSEGKSPTLIGVGDVGEVIVEVVEGGVSTRGLVEGNGSSRVGHCVERSMTIEGLSCH